MFPLDVRAAMAIGVLFGREEDEEGANTVPAEATERLITVLFEVLEGNNASNPSNIAQALLCMSGVRGAQDRARPNFMGLASLGLEISIFYDFRYIVFLSNATWG